MKTLKLLLLLLISTTVVSCSDNDNEPSPVVAPEVPNKLVGTRWIADPDNLNATIDNHLSTVNAIEFFNNSWCIYGDEFLKYSYDEAANVVKINSRLTFSDPDFIINDYQITATPHASYDESETYTFSFIKDRDYVAPAANNELAGSKWIGEFDYGNGDKVPLYLEFIDNQRYVSYDPLLSNGKTHYIHNYTYDNGTLIVDGKDSYKIKGNKITMFDITFTKQ